MSAAGHVDGATLWVVSNSRGEYSDRIESVVCICPDEATARAYVEEATRLAHEIEARFGPHPEDEWQDPLPAYLISRLDPLHRFSSYSPTTYFCGPAHVRLSTNWEQTAAAAEYASWALTPEATP